MLPKRPRWHLYLTGGTYIGPAWSLKIAEQVLRGYDKHEKVGEPIGTIYEEDPPGVQKLFRSYYSSKGGLAR
jgi:hypothetical protein